MMTVKTFHIPSRIELVLDTRKKSLNKGFDLSFECKIYHKDLVTWVALFLCSLSRFDATHCFTEAATGIDLRGLRVAR